MRMMTLISWNRISRRKLRTRAAVRGGIKREHTLLAGLPGIGWGRGHHRERRRTRSAIVKAWLAVVCHGRIAGCRRSSRALAKVSGLPGGLYRDGDRTRAFRISHVESVVLLIILCLASLSYLLKWRIRSFMRR